MRTTVLLSVVTLAVFVAAPAVAKSRTQPHHAGPALAHQNSTDIGDIQTGQMLGTDPDPRVRYQLRRDGSSSWEAGAPGSE
jgi:hypothetical protein